MKHTPGPWFVEGRTVYALEPQPAKPWLDRNRFSAGFYIGPGMEEAECEANAKLAAAAPDLLKALKNIISAYYASTLDEAIEYGRAVIAKAVGDDE